MTRNLIIVVLVAVCLVLTVFGMIQMKEAKRQTLLGERNAIAAIQANKELTACRAEAERMRAIAQEQLKIATEAMQKARQK